MSSWHSYPSIYNLGHRYISNLLTVPVNVEEKIDGSQFSFCVDDGEIKVRSKGAVMVTDAPEKMFTKAVDTVKELAGILHLGWTYRGEYLAKPKHNTLVYSRTPNKYVILFDISDGEESYLSYEDKKAEADRIGLEVVPLIYSGMVEDISKFREFLDTPSILGGQKVEGVVIKPRDYNLFGQDKKVLMGKFVSEAFKEIHGGEWKSNNPTPLDVVSQLASDLATPARWNKAIQHLAESGTLEESPRDIGPLMKEVVADVEKECIEEIKDRLFQFAWPHIKRKVTAGLPEWYKQELLKKQFGGDDANQS